MNKAMKIGRAEAKGHPLTIFENHVSYMPKNIALIIIQVYSAKTRILKANMHRSVRTCLVLALISWFSNLKINIQSHYVQDCTHIFRWVKGFAIFWLFICFILQITTKSRIQRSHCIALSENTILLVLCPLYNYISLSKRRTLSLRLPFPLGYWSVARAWSAPLIETSNNPSDNMLSVSSVWFPQVPGEYSKN